MVFPREMGSHCVKQRVLSRLSFRPLRRVLQNVLMQGGTGTPEPPLSYAPWARSHELGYLQDNFPTVRPCHRNP